MGECDIDLARVDSLVLNLAERGGLTDGSWERLKATIRATDELREAVLPILSAYRSTEAHITEGQVERAWAAYDAVHKESR